MSAPSPDIQAFFDRYASSRSALDVDSTFIVFVNRGAFEIVFQHEHEEFQQALRASGVLPPTP